jgi:nitrogen fixation protein
VRFTQVVKFTGASVIFGVAENLHPVSLRFAPQFVERLERAAESVGLPKHTLAQAAVRAAVEAIEEAGGKVVMPIEFDLVVQSLPVPNPKTKRSSRKKDSV